MEQSKLSINSLNLKAHNKHVYELIICGYCISRSIAASEKVTLPSVELIFQQEMSFSCNVVDAQHLTKSEVTSKCQAQEERAVTICNLLSPDLQRTVSLSSEKGTSSWLSALPVEEHGFALHKGAF